MGVQVVPAVAAEKLPDFTVGYFSPDGPTAVKISGTWHAIEGPQWRLRDLSVYRSFTVWHDPNRLVAEVEAKVWERAVQEFDQSEFNGQWYVTRTKSEVRDAISRKAKLAQADFV